MLSKSDYILARSCRAKLFFRENGYPDRRDGDPYMRLLAEGGYMVEALAKTRYPDGIQPEYGRGAAADFTDTLRFLNQDSITLFEPTLVVGRRQARVDILVKQGNSVRLIEVKAKSFDGQEHVDSLARGAHGTFGQIKKPGPVRSEWLGKLEDLTYQVLLLEQLLPGIEIRPYLALVDKSKLANPDNVPRFFELVQLALPYHAGMRPCGLVSFPWSCHTVNAAGEAPSHSEWLNDVDVWPNHTFVQSLRAAIVDEGPVLIWSHFEGSVLNEIIDDLKASGRSDPELVDWIRGVVDTRIVDLHRWAETQYYHPGTRGRTSIKVVLDALWKSDAAMRAQFENWSGLVADATTDPYSSLPPVEINGVWQDVHEGTGAMRAYQEMMYGVGSSVADTKARWAELLRQYCKLDTMSMVLIFEHWRRLTADPAQ